MPNKKANVKKKNMSQKVNQKVVVNVNTTKRRATPRPRQQQQPRQMTPFQSFHNISMPNPYTTQIQSMANQQAHLNTTLRNLNETQGHVVNLLRANVQNQMDHNTNRTVNMMQQASEAGTPVDVESVASNTTDKTPLLNRFLKDQSLTTAKRKPGKPIITSPSGRIIESPSASSIGSLVSPDILKQGLAGLKKTSRGGSSASGGSLHSSDFTNASDSGVSDSTRIEKVGPHQYMVKGRDHLNISDSLNKAGMLSDKKKKKQEEGGAPDPSHDFYKNVQTPTKNTLVQTETYPLAQRQTDIPLAQRLANMLGRTRSETAKINNVAFAPEPNKTEPTKPKREKESKQSIKQGEKEITEYVDKIGKKNAGNVAGRFKSLITKTESKEDRQLTPAEINKIKTEYLEKYKTKHPLPAATTVTTGKGTGKTGKKK